jgi:hypothetical protein
MHPVKSRACDVYNYRQYFNELNLSRPMFPMPIRSVARFENLNPSCVNDFYLDEESKEIVPLYVTKQTMSAPCQSPLLIMVLLQ